MYIAMEPKPRWQQEVDELLEEAAEARALAEIIGTAGAAAQDLQGYAGRLETEAEMLKVRHAETGSLAASPAARIPST